MTTKEELEKLVKNDKFSRLASSGILKLTKSKIRRVASPHIRAHKVKGQEYYYYVPGSDKEIYLGSADTILLAVMKYRSK